MASPDIDQEALSISALLFGFITFWVCYGFWVGVAVGLLCGYFFYKIWALCVSCDKKKK